MKIENKIKLSVILINLLLIIFKFSSCSDQNTLNNIPSDMTIQAAGLYSDFESNEVQANKKYVGKVIEVIGTVKQISNAPKEAKSIILEANNIGSVQCNFGLIDQNELLNLKAGEVIKIKGRCSGFLLDVQLDQCVFVNS